MKNLLIFEECFKEGMLNKDFESFKRTHPTLLKVVLRAMQRATETNTVLCKPASDGAEGAAVGQRSVGTNAEARAVDEYARGFDAGCNYILKKYNINGHRAEAPSEGHL